jgi:hypothetical protein
MPGLPSIRPAPDLPPGPRAALVIATSAYADPELSQLRAPARDADELVQILGDPDVAAFTVTALIDQPEPVIRRAVGAFLADRGIDDLVLVYLSCHGLLDMRGRLFFAATDTAKGQLSATALESAWLLDRLDECRARRQVLILDCCFSGAFARGGKGDVDLQQRLTGQGRGRTVLTASRAGEYSFEGTPLPGQAVPGSVFTAALIEGVRTGAADLNGDGYITLDEAYSYAFERVRQDSEQTPQRWLYGAEGSLVLARNPAGISIKPAPIPRALRDSLDSPYPGVRIGAVSALAEWLTGGDPGRALTAHRTLQDIADNDSPAVAAAARGHLTASASITAAPRTEAEPTAEPPPATEPRPETAGDRRRTRTWLTRGPRRRFLVIALTCVTLAAAVAVPLLLTMPHAPSRPDASGSISVPAAPDAVADAPDGTTAASGYGNGNVYVWNTTTQQVTAKLANPGGHGADAVAFARSGTALVAGYGNGTVWVWDITTMTVTARLTAPVSQSVHAVALGPGGTVAAGYGNGSTYVWNTTTGKRIATLPNSGSRGADALAFAMSGTALVAGYANGSVYEWDTATKIATAMITAPGGLGVVAVAYAPDGTTVAVAEENGSSYLWSTGTGSVVGPLADHDSQGGVWWVGFMKSGTELAVVDKSGVLSVYVLTS